MTIILQGFRGPDKKFDISFRAFYRTFDKSVDDPAATLLQPLGHLFANTPMNSRIAHHATLAHFIRARLELGFEQGAQTPTRPDKAKRYIQHFGKRHEACVTYRDVVRLGNKPGGQMPERKEAGEG